MSDNAPFSMQLPSSKRKENRGSKTRHSLPDLFEGLNSQSSSVSFQSPVVSTAPPSHSLLPPPPPAPTSPSPPGTERTKEDETLKMLQRHYLQAILTLAPPHKLSVSITWTKTTCSISISRTNNKFMICFKQNLIERLCNVSAGFFLTFQ